MSFPKQEKLNASGRMATLFNAINNELKSSLHYTGSMKKGNRDRINHNNGEFDIDADIFLNIDTNIVDAQKTYSDIKTLIKRNKRHHETIKLISAKNSENAIIHIKSQTAKYTFDIAIKTYDGCTLRFSSSNNKFYWK